MRGLFGPLIAVVAIALGVFALVDRMASDDRAAQRRALSARDAELTAQALAPGSALACLDGTAGEAVENACEKAVFAGPQNAAAAVAYVSARLSLLADGMALSERDPGFAAVLAGSRRAIELDRFGIAAHVLSTRDGCTVDRCAAFFLLRELDTIKANMKVRAFETYVGRYSSAWIAEPDKQTPVAAKEPANAPQAETNLQPANAKPTAKFDYPSAASIPAISIMNAEPKAAAQPKEGEPKAEGEGEPPLAKLPPKRPQNQASGAPAR
jgi:hypothetical protein